MKTVKDSLVWKIKGLTRDIESNLSTIKNLNEEIKEFSDRNETNRIAIDEATNALSILFPDYKQETE